MKSGGGQAVEGNNIICLSDDEDESFDVAAAVSSDGDLDLPSETTGVSGVSPPHTSPGKGKGGGLANGRGIGSPGSIRPSTPSQAAASPGLTSTAAGRVASPATVTPSAFRGGGGPSSSTPSAATTMDATHPSAGDANGNRAAADVMEDPVARRGSLAKRRNSYVQTLLSQAGCVLVIDNLEVDTQPFDVLAQLTKFGNNKGRIHSVYIPPQHPDLNRAIAYVVFVKKEFANTAAAFLRRNFVVSASGRPWIVSRCVQELNEDDFDFPTLSAFRGEPETEGDGDSFGGLKIITEEQEADYRAAKKRRVLFEQHRKQTQLLLERHAQEEKKVTDDPGLSLYRE